MTLFTEPTDSETRISIEPGEAAYLIADLALAMSRGEQIYISVRTESYQWRNGAAGGLIEVYTPNHRSPGGGREATFIRQSIELGEGV